MWRTTCVILIGFCVAEPAAVARTWQERPAEAGASAAPAYAAAAYGRAAWPGSGIEEELAVHTRPTRSYRVLETEPAYLSTTQRTDMIQQLSALDVMNGNYAVPMPDSGGPRPASVEGQELQQVGNTFYFFGRGVFRMPPGWRVRQVARHDLLIARGTEDHLLCWIGGGANGSEGKGPFVAGRTAQLLTQDYVDFFATMASKRGGMRDVRLWVEERGAHRASRFNARMLGDFDFQGRKLQTYTNINTIKMVSAGVSMGARCTNIGLENYPDVGWDVFDAISIDATRARIFNWRDIDDTEDEEEDDF